MSSFFCFRKKCKTLTRHLFIWPTPFTRCTRTDWKPSKAWHELTQRNLARGQRKQDLNEAFGVSVALKKKNKKHQCDIPSNCWRFQRNKLFQRRDDFAYLCPQVRLASDCSIKAHPHQGRKNRRIDRFVHKLNHSIVPCGDIHTEIAIRLGTSKMVFTPNLFGNSSAVWKLVRIWLCFMYNVTAREKTAPLADMT